MIPNYDYEVQTSYTLQLFFVVSILCLYYVTDLVKKLQLCYILIRIKFGHWERNWKKTNFRLNIQDFNQYLNFKKVLHIVATIIHLQRIYFWTDVICVEYSVFLYKCSVPLQELVWKSHMMMTGFLTKMISMLF